MTEPIVPKTRTGVPLKVIEGGLEKLSLLTLSRDEKVFKPEAFTAHDSLRSVKIVGNGTEDFKTFVNMNPEEQDTFLQVLSGNWGIIQEGKSPINPEEVMFEPDFLFIRSTNKTGPKFEISVWEHEVVR